MLLSHLFSSPSVNCLLIVFAIKRSHTGAFLQLLDWGGVIWLAGMKFFKWRLLLNQMMMSPSWLSFHTLLFQSDPSLLAPLHWRSNQCCHRRLWRTLTWVCFVVHINVSKYFHVCETQMHDYLCFFFICAVELVMLFSVGYFSVTFKCIEIALKSTFYRKVIH